MTRAANDTALAREYLLKVSMITSLRKPRQPPDALAPRRGTQFAA